MHDAIFAALVFQYSPMTVHESLCCPGLLSLKKHILSCCVSSIRDIRDSEEHKLIDSSYEKNQFSKDCVA